MPMASTKKVIKALYWFPKKFLTIFLCLLLSCNKSDAKLACLEENWLRLGLSTLLTLSDPLQGGQNVYGKVSATAYTISSPSQDERVKTWQSWLSLWSFSIAIKLIRYCSLVWQIDFVTRHQYVTKGNQSSHLLQHLCVRQRYRYVDLYTERLDAW